MSRRPQSPPPLSRRLWRAAIRVTLYLLAFLAVLLAVTWLYRFPAFRSAIGAGDTRDPHVKRRLGAAAWLLMLVVLFVLFAGLLLAFRIGRFFFPRATPPRNVTEYTDAWAESGRRLRAADATAEDEN